MSHSFRKHLHKIPWRACLCPCVCIRADPHVGLTSRPAPASCTSHTRAPAPRPGRRTRPRAAGWGSSPARWSAAAAWPHRRRSPPGPGWGRSTPPGCRAASCSRRCTATSCGAGTHNRRGVGGAEIINLKANKRNESDRVRKRRNRKSQVGWVMCRSTEKHCINPGLEVCFSLGSFCTQMSAKSINSKRHRLIHFYWHTFLILI